MQHHRELLVVGRREREQGDFVPPRVDNPALDFLHDLVRALLAERPVHVAGEAEAASPRAAAHHLDAQPVVRDLGRGDQRALRVVLRQERRDVAEPRLRGRRVRERLARDVPERVLDLGVKRRNVDALDGAHAPDHLGARHAGFPALGHEVAELLDYLFPVPDHETVDERRQGLRVHRAETARDHDRIVLAEVDHREHVGVRELVLEREADQIELPGRRARLERVERQPLRAHQALHVAPRREAKLGDPVGAPVDDVVEDLEPEVGHPDLVEVGETKQEANAGLGGILPRRVEKASRVPTRLRHERQVCFIQKAELVHGASPIRLGSRVTD